MQVNLAHVLHEEAGRSTEAPFDGTLGGAPRASDVTGVAWETPFDGALQAVLADDGACRVVIAGELHPLDLQSGTLRPVGR